MTGYERRHDFLPMTWHAEISLSANIATGKIRGERAPFHPWRSGNLHRHRWHEKPGALGGERPLFEADSLGKNDFNEIRERRVARLHRVIGASLRFPLFLSHILTPRISHS
jgi:hypothetical protein